MAKIEFDIENKASNPDEFPKLKLELNEKARISLIETAPEMSYVHVLRKPVIGDDGKFVMEPRVGKKGTYMVLVTEFIGQHHCFGNFDVVAQQGDDPDNCPTCRAARDQEGISKPERRFAMNVLQYVCEAGSFKPQQPLQLRCVVWAFGDKRYNEIADMAEAWKDDGGLRYRDIELGPCESPAKYQKFNMTASPQSLWTKTKEDQQRGAEVYKNNRLVDLEIAIARKPTKAQVEQDIAKVVEAYDIGNGRKDAGYVAPSSAETDANVASILDGFDAPPSQPASEMNTTGLDDVFDAIKAEQAADQPTTVNEVGEVEESAPAAEESKGEPMDLDQMLADLS